MAVVMNEREAPYHPRPMDEMNMSSLVLKEELDKNINLTQRANEVSLEESFQEIALVDSGKLMLPVGSREDMESTSFSDDPSVHPVSHYQSPAEMWATPTPSPETSIPTSAPSQSASPSQRSLVPLGNCVGGKDMLLRLLQSDYFDAWIGLAYLWRYNGRDVGLQYLLCERMRQRPMDEIEFVLPQIWYTILFLSLTLT